MAYTPSQHPWTAPPTPAPPPPLAPRSRKPLIVGLVAAAVLLLAGAGLVLVWLGNRPTQLTGPSAWEIEQSKAADRVLERAQAACDPTLSGTQVTDNYQTLIVDTRGSDDWQGTTVEALGCLLSELRAPQAVVAHIDGTRALDGRQEDTWEGFTASWTYHPDDGLDMIVRKA